MINEQRWKMNYIGLLEARNIFSENVNFGCQAAGRAVGVIEEGECVCVCVRSKVQFFPCIFCRINTSLLLPITLVLACLNTASFTHAVVPPVCTALAVKVHTL